MQYIDALEGRTIVLNQHRYLNFSGTSYLAINTHPIFQQLLIEGIQRYGSNFGGSRLSNTRFAIFEEAEAQLCELTSAESAFTVSSGMLAGQIIQQLIPSSYFRCYEADTHPALWHVGIDLPAFSYKDWTKKVLQLADQNIDLAIFCNSIDPLRVEPYDFSWLGQLPSHRNIILVIDDSHGLGVIGRAGGGIFTLLPALGSNIQILVVASLGKAFGIPGGVILTNATWFNQLKNSYFYGSASPITPAYLHAFVQASVLYRQQLEQLQTNIAHFHALLQTYEVHYFRYLPNFPVFYTVVSAIYAYLLGLGILTSSFPYPTSQDALITRVILNAAHTKEDISLIINYLSDFKLLNIQNK